MHPTLSNSKALNEGFSCFSAERERERESREESDDAYRYSYVAVTKMTIMTKASQDYYIPYMPNPKPHKSHDSPPICQTFLGKGKPLFPAKRSFLNSYPFFNYCPSSPISTPQSTEEEEKEKENMKETSKVIMGATLVMVVSLAIILALILVLLAELYCSLLLRRRRQLRESTSGRSTISNTATAAIAANTPANTISSSFPPLDNCQDQSTILLSSFYAQGVLHAPRNFLFPALLPWKQDKLENDNHLTSLHQVHAQESNPSPHQMGVLPPTSPSTSFVTSPNPVQEILIQVDTRSTYTCPRSGMKNLVYISNPIYDNVACRPDTDTPFETPDTSPSCLENSGSSGDDDEKKVQFCQTHVRVYSPPMTPPLSPMKKLPAQACSVSLKSLGISGSDSNSNNTNNGLSSSSSASPCTSPSW